MVVVKISETYDMATSVNNLGLLGIHTPSTATIKTMWDGLFKNYKFFKLLQCDITLACASMLPADPLQVGTESGKVAPQDMFNPMLFRAVSNDGFETLINRLYSSTAMNSLGSVNEYDVNMPSGTEADEFDLYYGLLADPSWKKAMPQQGLSMKGLYPLVYQLISNYGNEQSPASSSNMDNVISTGSTGTTGSTSNVASNFRGPSMRMPRLPTILGVSGSAPIIPTTYVAAIIVPPAKLSKLYYRMRVTWTIEFTDLITIPARQNFASIGESAPYHSNWLYGSAPSKDLPMDEKGDMVDTKSMDLQMIMQS